MTEDSKMKEMHPDNLSEIINGQNVQCIYFYTRLCGTCQLASKMLEIVSVAIPKLTINKCNLNFAPKIAHDYQIKSVPCLTIWRHGIILEKIYAFHSVSQLYDILIKYEKDEKS